ncbi:ribosomal protein S18-alanine N-acetyltransferase [Clostridium sp. DL1XJH146]
MCKLEIKEINQEFAEDIVKINHLCFKDKWSITTVHDELDSKFTKYFAAFYDNILVGYIGLWLILDEAHITSVAVHPEFRRLKIGSKLIQKSIATTNKLNINSYTLEVRSKNMPAINLYKSFGFKEEGLRKNYYKDDDAIIMWKRTSFEK